MKLSKGLDLPILGDPVQEIHRGPQVRRVAVNGLDYIGLKPRMMVAEGDTVAKGQPLFVHKEAPEVFYTAPAAGRIEAVNRGPKRVLETIVIEVDETGGEITFDDHAPDALGAVTADEARNTLFRSGLWTSFRTRPFSKVPLVGDVPRSIFVTAMDSEPLAPDAGLIIKRAADDFAAGLKIIAKLTDGNVFVCHYPRDDLPGRDLERVVFRDFDGPHPAGLAGTHIHFIDPVTAEKTVWTIGYQDVIAIGRLFATGRLDTERIISIAGPLATTPRLLRTRLGASTDELTNGEIDAATPCRIISGSVLGGRVAAGHFAYLGRYHRQITLMEEDTRREVLGWLIPKMEKYSFINVQLSSLVRRTRKFAFGTNLNGSPRAMVPLGSYERVVPMDILPTQLLRAIVIRDTDTAQALGVLELDEEDLALCTFVCHSKYEFGEALRASLEKIEKEG